MVSAQAGPKVSLEIFIPVFEVLLVLLLLRVRSASAEQEDHRDEADGQQIFAKFRHRCKLLNAESRYLSELKNNSSQIQFH